MVASDLRPLPSRLHRLLHSARPWRELGVLGTMLMGLSWGVPWFRSLTQATYALSTGYAFAVFGGMMLLAYLCVRALNALRLRADLRRGLLLLLLVASVLAGLKLLLFAEENVTLADLTGRQLRSFADAYALVPNEFIITMAVLIAWRRGTQLANEKLGPQLIQNAFGIGIFMFFFYIFFNTFVTGETPGNMPVLFLFAGLMAMGAARVAVISTLRGGRDNPFDRRWVAGLAFSVAGVVGLAAWIGAEMGGGEGALGLLPRFLLGAILAVGFLILTPVFALMWWALYAFIQTVQVDNPLSDQLNEMAGLLRGMAEDAMVFLDPLLGPLGDFLARYGLMAKALVLWLIVLVLVLVIVLAAYVQDSRRRALLREQYERIAARGLWQSLRDSLRSGLQQAGQNLANAFDLERRRRLLAAAQVRRIYAELMDLCIDLHSPRPEACTPHEFLPTLNDLFPEQRAEALAITQAYELVRYGELPESPLEVPALQTAWEHMRAHGERRKAGQG